MANEKTTPTFKKEYLCAPRDGRTHAEAGERLRALHSLRGIKK